MALVISAVQVTGTAIAYTVPAGKVAKVRVVFCDVFGNIKTLTIGNYKARNDTDYDLGTDNQGQDGTPTTNSFAPPVAGFVRAASTGADLERSFMYFKEDHVLVAGETVSCDDTSATFAYTIFEEDA
jgi:hypothetical protein